MLKNIRIMCGVKFIILYFLFISYKKFILNICVNCTVKKILRTYFMFCNVEHELFVKENFNIAPDCGSFHHRSGSVGNHHDCWWSRVLDIQEDSFQLLLSKFRSILKINFGFSSTVLWILNFIFTQKLKIFQFIHLKNLVTMV